MATHGGEKILTNNEYSPFENYESEENEWLNFSENIILLVVETSEMFMGLRYCIFIFG